MVPNELSELDDTGLLWPWELLHTDRRSVGRATVGYGLDCGVFQLQRMGVGLCGGVKREGRKS